MSNKTTEIDYKKLIDDLTDQLSNDISSILSTNIASSAMYISGAGGGGGGSGIANSARSSGVLTTTTAHTTILPSGMVSGTTFTWPQQLTLQEKEELNILRDQHKEQSRVAKLDEFKKLPAALRQHVINVLVWQEVKQKIESCELEKSDRLKDLEMRDSMSTLNGFGSVSSGLQLDPNWPMAPTLPKDISAEDLKSAHSDASLEEEMLSNEANG
jgi:hypothetical protein